MKEREAVRKGGQLLPGRFRSCACGTWIFVTFCSRCGPRGKVMSFMLYALLLMLGVLRHTWSIRLKQN